MSLYKYILSFVQIRYIQYMWLSLVTWYETISSFRIIFTGKFPFIWALRNKKEFFLMVVLFTDDFLTSAVLAEVFHWCLSAGCTQRWHKHLEVPWDPGDPLIRVCPHGPSRQASLADRQMLFQDVQAGLWWRHEMVFLTTELQVKLYFCHLLTIWSGVSSVTRKAITLGALITLLSWLTCKSNTQKSIY